MVKRVVLGLDNCEKKKVIADGEVEIRFSKIPDFRWDQEHYIVTLGEILYRNHPCKIIDYGNFNLWDQLYYDDDFLIHASVDIYHPTPSNKPQISLNLYVNQTYITCTANGTAVEPTEYGILMNLGLK